MAIGLKSLLVFFLGLTQAFGANSSSRVVDMDLVDPKVSPCEDFFQYSCGRWLKKTEIPADRPKVYRFSEIDVETEKILKRILEDYQKGQREPQQKDADKLGAFYQSCMNEKTAEREARKGIKSLFKKIEELRGEMAPHRARGLADLLAELHKVGISAFYTLYVDQDPGDARQILPHIDQGGIGLPEKSYYFDEDRESKKIRSQYVKHIARMLQLAGVKSSNFGLVAKRILEVETQLAKASMSSIDRRDPKSLYNKMTLGALQDLAPEFDWLSYFTAVGIQQDLSVNVAVPSFAQAFALLSQDLTFDDLRAYLQWQVVHSIASFASQDLIAEDFNFYGKILSGQKAQSPRWKVCVSSVDENLGEALGEAFVEVAFGEDARRLAMTMMDQIQAEVRQMFSQLDWMDQHTMQGALRKLDTLMKKVGYPATPQSYQDYEVSKRSWFQNVLEGNRFEFQRQIAKIGKPVDRSEWGMTASTNNAYYNPLLNEIVFPAGILQEPLFSVRADLAANYGATGATIGHEITHGFDDEGRQFDENGNLNDWWSPEATQSFGAKAQCLEKQYDQYRVADGVAVQGKLTLGENIADLGGLKIALRAYTKASSTNPTAQDYQRFFVAYAQSWCGKATPEYEKQIVQVDPHSPARFRVNGVVVNMPEFAEAFSCKANQKMNPSKRCEIW